MGRNGIRNEIGTDFSNEPLNKSGRRPPEVRRTPRTGDSSRIAQGAFGRRAPFAHGRSSRASPRPPLIRQTGAIFPPKVPPEPVFAKGLGPASLFRPRLHPAFDPVSRPREILIRAPHTPSSALPREIGAFFLVRACRHPGRRAPRADGDPAAIPAGDVSAPRIAKTEWRIDEDRPLKRGGVGGRAASP